MYVCVCHGITDGQIRRVVDQGACSLPEVQMHLPVAGCCGRCEDSACALIREQRSLTANSCKPAAVVA